MTTAEKYSRLINEKIPATFEAGKAQGGGGDGWYDTFWDTYQQNGNRTDYAVAFRSLAWSDDNFKPKYDIKMTGVSSGVFQYSGITRLKGKLDELGLILDTSECITLLQMFQGTNIKDVPIIDGSNATSLSYTFGSSPMVETIEKLILTDKLTTVSNAFLKAERLAHVIFEGILAITGLDLHWSVLLDAESYNSLMNILSPNTTGMSITLPSYETVKTTYDAVYGDGAWDAIVATKSNWTIAYM